MLSERVLALQNCFLAAMAALVGSCYKDVCLMFLDLPSRDISLHGDPLATRLLPTKLYLLRLREVDAVHSVQYKVNTSYIETLYSHVNKATERVAQCILAVTGGTHSAQQAAAALRSCRVLETPDEIRKRTMVSGVCMPVAFGRAAVGLPLRNCVVVSRHMQLPSSWLTAGLVSPPHSVNSVYLCAGTPDSGNSVQGGSSGTRRAGHICLAKPRDGQGVC